MHFICKYSHFFREEVYAVTTPTSVNVGSITSIDIKVNGENVVLVSSLYSTRHIILYQSQVHRKTSLVTDSPLLS